MKYMGSKRRLAKELVPILMAKHKKDMWYIEPFVGGCNMMEHIPAKKRFGSDSHEYLIAMWIGLRDGTFNPPTLVTEDEYKDIRENKNKYDPALVGYVGFSMSFGGKWFGGYRRDVAGQQGNIRNMETQSRLRRDSILLQLQKLKDVRFVHKDYNSLWIPRGSTVYCDPPYFGTTKYKDDFDHDKFWNWVRFVSITSTVYVSEYTAPDDFVCLWQKEVNNTLVKDTGSKQGIEKLFIWEELVR